MNLEEFKEIFNEARKLYPGTVKGNEKEFANFKKRSTKPVPDGIKFDFNAVIHLLKPAIEYQIRYRAYCASHNIWVACWKNFQTWINQGCWEEEYSDYVDVVPTKLTPEQIDKIKTAREKLRKDARHVKS